MVLGVTARTHSVDKHFAPSPHRLQHPHNGPDRRSLSFISQDGSKRHTWAELFGGSPRPTPGSAHGAPPRCQLTPFPSPCSSAGVSALVQGCRPHRWAGRMKTPLTPGFPDKGLVQPAKNKSSGVSSCWSPRQEVRG